MKAKAIFFLLVFTSFITIPAILTCIDNQYDVSVVFNFAEEENAKHKSASDVMKEYIPTEKPLAFITAAINAKKKPFPYFLKFENTIKEILLPPPEQILV